MSAYATSDIRNIAFVGHAGSGKTTLVEALLHVSGMINARGSVEKGNTICDFETEEKQFHHSLSPAIVNLDYDGIHTNLIDTPGYPDFMGQTLSVLPAVETMALVIDAQTGVETVSRRMMEWAKKHGYCRMIIVNKIDAGNHNIQRLLDEIREEFGKECLPINLPTKNNGGVIDCFFQAAGDSDLGPIADAHTALIDQVVEVDEQLMELYLEQGGISPQQLHTPFETAMRNGHLIPVCFTSAREDQGVKELLGVFAKLLPNPMEGTPHIFYDSWNPEARKIHAEPNPDKHVLAHVFRISYDPFVGKMGIFRVHQGVINKDTQLIVDDQRKAVKVAHLFKLQGKQYVESDTGIPGDICAVGKIDAMHFDAVLHDSHDEDFVHFPVDGLPQPMVGLAIEPKTRGDEQKISDTLEKITAEDPCLVVERHASSNETVLRGLGDLHLRVALEKIKERFHVDVDTHPPTIAYRETILRPAEGHHRHKKQSGGAGQFGEVFLRIEPLERGAGFEFVNKVVGGTIPGQFIPAVEKGVRQTLADGAIAGFPIHDVRVTVYDGKHHSVDSNEISFVTAGSKAFIEAVKNANPIILEPIVNIETTIPNVCMGDITGDLAARRGRINDTKALANGTVVVSGQVPLAELEDYQSRLKSMTGGEGDYTLEFSHYDAVPPNIQQQLQKSFSKKHE